MNRTELPDHCLDACFIATPKGRVFCVMRTPADPSLAGARILIVPPFTEELNRSRSFLARAGRQLALAGHTVVQPDLLGTGDSERAFAEVSWSDWIESIGAASEMGGVGRLILLAIRGGALLLDDACDDISARGVPIDRTVLVEPVLSGKKMMRDCIRTRVARSMFHGKVETTSMLEHLIENDGVLEIDGYIFNLGLYQAVISKEVNLENTALRLDVVSINRARHAYGEPSINSLRGSEKAAPAAAKAQLLKFEPFWALDREAHTDALESEIIRVAGI